jgi:4-aminobutyrate--pyruvate transaminase
MLPKFKKAGINWFCLGIEAGNQTVRREVSKGSFQDINIREVVANVRESGINVISNFIVGFPEDTLETMQQTEALSFELCTEMMNVYPCQALPGSPLYYRAKEKGWKLPDSYAGFAFLAYETEPLPTNHRSFDLPIQGVLHTTCPHFYRFGVEGETEEQFATRCAEELEALIIKEGGAEQVAAMICEPVMGAGGVIVPPKGYYEKIQAVCTKYDMLFVADEVICGFGRTGNVWGSQTMNIKPDILTCAKALSASFLPISAVMVSEKVYQALMSESDKIGTWGHGFTYSGHPVAAAVALEAQKIYDETDLFGHAKRMSPVFSKHVQSFADHPLVGEAMSIGMMGALEIVADKKTKTPFDLVAVGAGLRVYNHAVARGLFIRNMGDRVAICPPLVINETELGDLFGRLRQAFDATLADLVSEGLFKG